MQLDSGDLLLLEPSAFELKDTLFTWWNGCRFSRCGIIMKKGGIDYCVECRGRTMGGKFFIVTQTVSSLFRENQGKLWYRKLGHPREENFTTRLALVLELAQMLPVALGEYSDYSGAFLGYIYRYLDVLPNETLWKNTEISDFQTRSETETKPNLKLLWLYPVSKEFLVKQDTFS